MLCSIGRTRGCWRRRVTRGWDSTLLRRLAVQILHGLVSVGWRSTGLLRRLPRRRDGCRPGGPASDSAVGFLVLRQHPAWGCGPAIVVPLLCVRIAPPLPFAMQIRGRHVTVVVLREVVRLGLGRHAVQVGCEDVGGPQRGLWLVDAQHLQRERRESHEGAEENDLLQRSAVPVTGDMVTSPRPRLRGAGADAPARQHVFQKGALP
mmetsp:Transcript_16934/g.47731  ORF Transcript_16934/g.47731 Transcript_16934/m.47731 type:complete len:206 (-) Transcript_16934:623-1240(-)